MRSDDFNTTKMDGLRPVYAEELTRNAHDPTTLAYALNKYLRSAEEKNYMNKTRTAAVMDGMISYIEIYSAYVVTGCFCEVWPDGALPYNGLIIATQACFGIGQIKWDLDSIVFTYPPDI